MADRIKSFVLDIARDVPPKVDLIFCRDCLFHFPIALAWDALRNFQASGSRYLFTTTFLDGVNENVTLPAITTSASNLEAAPFNFPPPILSIPDSSDYPTRFMAFVELSTLPRQHCRPPIRT